MASSTLPAPPALYHAPPCFKILQDDCSQAHAEVALPATMLQAHLLEGCSPRSHDATEEACEECLLQLGTNLSQRADITARSIIAFAAQNLLSIYYLPGTRNATANRTQIWPLKGFSFTGRTVVRGYHNASMKSTPHGTQSDWGSPLE